MSLIDITSYFWLYPQIQSARPPLQRGQTANVVVVPVWKRRTRVVLVIHHYTITPEIITSAESDISGEGKGDLARVNYGKMHPLLRDGITYLRSRRCTHKANVRRGADQISEFELHGVSESLIAVL